MPLTFGPGRRVEIGALCVRVVMSLFYALAGYAHLTHPQPFLAITPGWVPWPAQVIAVTGVCEILGAIGLWPRISRRLSGVMLALYAVCVFPANLNHAFGHVAAQGLPSSWWYHGPRLAMQPVLVWAALFAGGVTAWPFGRRPKAGAPPAP